MQRALAVKGNNFLITSIVLLDNNKIDENLIDSHSVMVVRLNDNTFTFSPKEQKYIRNS